ncbi:MAG: FYDLN acid domain-containing protein, partial [Roseiarcus sp.]|uniref:FYDLN acid domain-containing protein n=2 Tax=Roseiarcus sp. TaxID=1969460 RepID=UPI003C4D7F28
MAKKGLAAARLGTKRQCLACGAKYYDLGRTPPTCSRCGAEAGSKVTAEAPPPAPAAPEAAP